MITYTDIVEFFDQEAESAKKSWDALMLLPIKERIRKRKAIQGVILDRDFKEQTNEGYILLKLFAGKNLADFKEGECLILHSESSSLGIRCVINRFEGENEIFVEVFPLNMPSDMEPYYDTSLVLDRDFVDLRRSVYDNFKAKLPDDAAFWKEHLLNRRAVPEFLGMKECRDELDETLSKHNITLLSCQYEAVKNCMSCQDYYLIQGPPGTGKSFILGLVIYEELTYFHHKVIVIGPNHLAINNTLKQVFNLCPEQSIVKVGQTYNAARTKLVRGDKTFEILDIPRLNVDVAHAMDSSWCIGITPHGLYTSRARNLHCDTLVIDEAGQMTIPLALMGMIRAKKIILAGDHKQLPPIVTSENIRSEMCQSVFQRLVNTQNCMMLDSSFRMCGAICRFVSDLFYDGRLTPVKKEFGDAIVCDDPLYSFDHPVVLHHIDDQGEQTSDKEAEFVSDVIGGFLKRKLAASEIGVLVPFRAQAANVRRHIRKNQQISESEGSLLVADTIDKMQGQEREVIIFSLTSGKWDYITEMADFLYSPNKLNVAFSRAKSKLIIVGNIHQLKRLSGVDYPHIRKMLMMLK